jgi:hypothetical protein
MRTIGHRKEHPITFSASASLLLEGARFNDEIHRLPTGSSTFISKGVYRFKTHETANQHQQACLIEGMVQMALNRFAEVLDLDGIPVRTINLEGLLLTKQSMRDKDVADRIILERALEALCDKAKIA